MVFKINSIFILLLSVTIVTVNSDPASSIMDAAKSFGLSKLSDFFGKKDFSTKDLEPKNLKDLTTKVLMTGELINAFQKSKNDLMNVANDQQKGALAKIGDIKDIFMNFKKTMDENPGSFSLLKDNWKSVVEQVFKANNLQVLIPLLGKINSSSTIYCGMVTFLFPIIAAFIVRRY
uniref:SXP/RAL-2 family protein Ani s 5-like cation-binding domain-containing protein n=1 Tax=Strongyloides stercoralis TaxID=6248 RepID=A0A0K0ELA9_STRER